MRRFVFLDLSKEGTGLGFGEEWAQGNAPWGMAFGGRQGDALCKGDARVELATGRLSLVHVNCRVTAERHYAICVPLSCLRLLQRSGSPSGTTTWD